MRCPDFDTLMLYLDGELDEGEMLRIGEHVERCEECRRVLSSQSMLEESWRSDFRFPETAEFRRMETEVYRKVHGRSRWRAIVPVAAGIIAALIGVKLIITGNPSLDRLSSISMERSQDYSLESAVEERPPMDEYDNRTEIADDLTGRTTDSSAGPAEHPEHSMMLEESEEVITEQENLEEEEVTEEIIVSNDQVDETASRGLILLTGEQAQVQAEGTGELQGDGGTACGGISFGGYDRLGLETVQDLPEATATDGSIGLAGGIAQEDLALDQEMEVDADILLSTTGETSASQSAAAGEPDWSEVSETPSTSSVHVHEESIEGMEPEESGEEVEMVCSAPEELFDRRASGDWLYLVFDETGMPDSMTAALLDSLSPGWRDYILSEFTDTVMVVPLAELDEILRYGGGVPAETIE